MNCTDWRLTFLISLVNGLARRAGTSIASLRLTVVQAACSVLFCLFLQVIVERFHKEVQLPKLEKEKYLVPAEGK